MASGNIDNIFQTGYIFRLAWNETSVNQSANTSAVHVAAQIITAIGKSISTSVARNISITCDDQTMNSTCRLQVPANSTVTLMEADFVVPHNSDGSKTAVISCTLQVRLYIDGTHFNELETSGNAVLTKFAKNPNAPTVLAAVSSNASGNGNYVGNGDMVALAWNGASGVITGYQIRVNYGGTGWTDLKTITSSATSGDATDTFTATSDLSKTGAGKTLQYAIRAMNGSLYSSWCYSNVLHISGGMDLKVSGSWKNGSVWIKSGGTWKRAKRIWIKIGGAWKESK